jgi:hypothetical protein
MSFENDTSFFVEESTSSSDLAPSLRSEDRGTDSTPDCELDSKTW